MAFIEVVIKIPEEDYKLIKETEKKEPSNLNYIARKIITGTVLPKGHGNLIDTNEITAFRELECNGRNVKSLNEFTVIIEADKGD